MKDRLAGLALEAGTEERLRRLDPDGWHVTLRFVGNVAPELVPALLESITPIDPFTIHLTEIEPFPSTRRPLVLAATGTADAAGHALVESLEAQCRALSLPPEKRPWRPHMSLARVRGRRSLQFPPCPIDLTMAVSAFVLMESVQGPTGNRYVPLAPAT